ncbi:alpha-amylase A-like [Episyrphus balteatus]|uniref:alpha-amylase A-like n=1 Tax=Episyrphus balteatus TaxID=286459 RepID=UPI0024863D1F|nr:alpha-amylase A-like [Episyrphus balteatus]
MILFKFFVLLSCAIFSSAQFNDNQEPNRNTIVHLFEWKWKDIAQECEDFLAPNGYGGVQLSPPSENVIVDERPWFERYQPVSYNLTTRSGNEEEFRDMVERCNKVGVRIYPDVVFNHMAALSGRGTGGSLSDPDNNNFPAVPYTAEDFHPTCSLKDYSNPKEVRNCELEGLKDLDQSKEHVRQKIVAFLNHLIDIGVAGIRVDGCKHMWPEDLKAIFSQLNDLNTEQGFPEGSRPFIFQEVIDLGGESVSSSEYTDIGTVTEFRFSDKIGEIFNKIQPLHTLNNFDNDFLPSDKALFFVENHDNQRQHGAGGNHILTFKQPKAYKMAIAFMLAYNYKNTRIMSSFDFTDKNQGPPTEDDGETILSPSFNEDGSCGNGWICEHRWNAIRNMIEFRNVVKGTEISNWWDNEGDQISFCREDKGFIIFNQEDADLDEDFKVCLPAGTYCDIITGRKSGSSCTGKFITIDERGITHINIAADDDEGVLAIHANSRLED